MVSQSSPLGFSTAHKYNYNRTTNNNSNTPNNNNTNNNISGIQEEREEDEEDSEEQFLDASEELPEQGIKDLILTNEPTSSSDIIKTKNSSASSLILLNNDEEEDIDKKPTFGRKSILVSHHLSSRTFLIYTPYYSWMNSINQKKSRKSCFLYLKDYEHLSQLL